MPSVFISRDEKALRSLRYHVVTLNPTLDKYTKKTIEGYLDLISSLTSYTI